MREHAMARLTPTLCAGLLLASQPAWSADGCQAQSGPNIAPLVELYTSEGCHDCPPADLWLSKLAKEADPSNTAVLAFHVDYWDDIGWPDRFATPRHGERQKARVTMKNSKTVVTPQVMVGENIMVKWRNPSTVNALMDKLRARPAPAELAIQVARQAEGLQVDFKFAPTSAAAKAAAPGYLWLALYQDGLTTAVRDGENKGKTLKHDRVVRSLMGPWPLGSKPVVGNTKVPLPEQADPKQLGLALFAESSETGAGWQSLNVPLAACLP